MLKEYDYLVVGSGLYGAIFAYEAKRRNKKVLVIEKRNHIGGNVYTENIEKINVHKYGAHIFHTNNKKVWEYINQFANFNRFTNSPIARYKNEIYSLPFNMYTFNKIWNVITPDEAKCKIEEQKRIANIGLPSNLEEQAISLVGFDIYEKLIKGYTEKQWGMQCKDLPSFIIKRLPVRYNYDNNYFDALYQGIPIGGYTKLIENMLKNIKVILNVDYLKNKEYFNSITKKIIYTGAIDAYFDYKLGYLEYRTLNFEHEFLNSANYQGNAVVNYTDKEIPWTRIIEHKWFEFGKDIEGNKIDKTIISKEYSVKWTHNDEPYYPINNEVNNNLYNKYRLLANLNKNIIFGGRLGEYKYYDMDKVIESVLMLVNIELK
jgi:UDP-galactopyranose mutase